MSENVLKLLYSESDGDEYIKCDTCGMRIYDAEPDIEQCPHCKRKAVLPTIAEYGKRLPVGIEKDGKLIKDFDLVKLNWAIERKVSGIISSQEWKKRLTIGSYISLLLAHTITSIGDIDISKFSIEKKLKLFKEMYQGDIFYMYAYLRLLSQGNELTIKDLECINNSNHVFTVVLDVSGIKVSTIESVYELKSTFELKDGIVLDKEARKKFTVTPLKWEAFDIGANMSQAEIIERNFLTSVYEIEGFNPGVVLSEHNLDDISKRDMNIIEQNLDMTHTGPVWAAEIKCPKCDHEMYFHINWLFKDFFTDSYLYGGR